ncbi:hypothetical protein G5714_019522 [Onychostoma macrolepis]|uniref:non-specific serine/threonine protein kinase n=1 Tax=Onychostoma macrolepis TaxID=369639 RepID=A0A7J6BWN7_9TELE|nr:hypothetical protein G5714_019522 [Onychostoma macrolepis]
MGLFSRPKKAYKVERRVHEPQPCELLKYTPITAENRPHPHPHPHPPDETPGGADERVDRKKEAVKQEKNKFYQTSLQHIPIVEIYDHQEVPASEVLGTQDVPQPQDVHTPVSLIEEDKVEELDKDQPSLHHIVEIHDFQEASVSEVLIPVEEQLEQDVLQPQDEVSSSEEPKYQNSLQQIVEIHDLGEAPVSEVLPAAEEQLEQDVLQPQDTHTPVGFTEDDEAEELDNSHIFWRYEFGPKLGEGGYGCVHAGTRCKDGLKVAVKIAEKTPDMLYIGVHHMFFLLAWSSQTSPHEIGLTLMANKGPSVPQIIKLLDWQDDTDHYVMVLERPMPSMSMFSFVKLRQKLNEGMAQHFIQQVIHAANICCERGVFHRDIKLENLLVNTDTLDVKLIDFVCGTLMKDFAYMAYNGTEMFCPPEFDVDGSKNDWSNPDLSQECCQIICSRLLPDPQRRLILEEMQLHDWFMVVE